MIIKVKVVPNSSQEKIVDEKGDELTVYLREPAKNNGANKKLIKLLSRRFNIHFQKVKIKNPSSRKKVVEIKID